MGFQMDVSRVVEQLWESLRPTVADTEYVDGGFGVRNGGLVVTLDLRLSHYALSCDEYHRSVLAHIILCGNTSVFASATSDHKMWWQMEGSQWDNTSNHDSCWRSDGFGFLNTLFFNMTEQMNHEMRAHGHAPLAPKDFNQFCTLGTIAGPMFETVKVHHERIPGESYRRRLVKVDRNDRPAYIPEINEG